MQKKGHPHPSVIAKCTCESRFQDKHYGKNMRVMNEKQGKLGGFRCTVCASMHASPEIKK